MIKTSNKLYMIIGIGLLWTFLGLVGGGLGNYARGQSFDQYYTLNEGDISAHKSVDRVVTLKTILEEIEESHNISFFYDDQLVENKFVAVPALKSDSLANFLAELLSQIGLIYKKQTDRTYVIMEKSTPPPRGSIQQEAITGAVTDAESGETLPGVNILVKGTSTGASTDQNGNFELEVPSLQDTLVVTYIGYQRQEVPIGGRTELDIQLTPEAIMGEEMVVVGYGEQRKVNLTGSVATVDGADLVNRPAVGTTDALQGAMPGAVITRTSGSPGQEGFDIQIRGLTSVNNNPVLVLIDGFEGDLDDVRPEDVENISVLKDAAAASIYGAKAAGGVVLITTKRGQAGKISVDYNSYLSTAKLGRLPERISSYEWALYRNLAEVNAGGSPVLSEQELGYLADPDYLYDVDPANPNSYRYWGDYDYLEMTMKEYTQQQNHNLSVSGGTEATRYRISGTWFNNEGMLDIGPDHNERYTGRLNLDSRISKHVEISNNLSYSRNVIEKPAGGGRLEGTYGFLSNIFTYPGVTPLYDPNGNWAWGARLGTGGAFDGRSKIADVSRDAGIKKWDQNDVTLNSTLKIDNITDGLLLRIVGAIDANFDNTIDHHRPVPEYGVDESRLEDAIYSGNEVRRWNTKSVFKEVQLLADYNIEFQNHAFHILGGYSAQGFRRESFDGRARGLVNSNLPDFDWASIESHQLSDDVATNAFQSVFGRINYNFDERYLLEGNLRYDGSSKLSPENRYQLFPSASAGWRLSEESWFNIELISEFKIRGSWGRLGNAGVLGNYDYIPLLNVSDDLIFNESRAQYVSQSTLASRNLSWETVESSNIGFDLGLLDDRLYITADYFTKRNKDMLARVAYPNVIGIDVPNQNAGELKTWGWEAEVMWRNNLPGKDFNYWVKGHISDAQNELVEYLGADVVGAGTRRLLEGFPVNSMWGFQTDGYFQSEAEVEAHAFQSNNTGPGDVKYLDLDGDGEINTGNQRVGDSGDLVHMGDTNPRYTFGLQSGFNWKAFDFRVFFQGVGKRVVLMDNFSFMPFFRNWIGPQKQHMDYWTPENPNALWPRPYARGEHNYRAADRWVQDAAYVRLKDIQVGYTIPQNIMSRLGIENLRVYFTGRDLWETTKTFDYIDPETPDQATFVYPFRRSFTVGMNLSF